MGIPLKSNRQIVATQQPEHPAPCQRRAIPAPGQNLTAINSARRGLPPLQAPLRQNHAMAERVIPLVDQRIAALAARVPTHPVAPTGLLTDTRGRPPPPPPKTATTKGKCTEGPPPPPPMARCGCLKTPRGGKTSSGRMQFLR